MAEINQNKKWKQQSWPDVIVIIINNSRMTLLKQISKPFFQMSVELHSLLNQTEGES